MAFSIELWNCSAENNRLDKTDYFDELVYDTISGTLRDDCSVMSPIITIEYKSTIVVYNYCYIEAFGRYYYIVDIVSRGGYNSKTNNYVWDLYLSVDVLMSFKDEILKLTGQVARNEYSYNPYLIDTNVSFTGKRKISQVFGHENFDGGFSDMNSKNDSRHYIVGLYSNIETYSATSGSSAINANTKDLSIATNLNKSPYTACSEMIAMSYSELLAFLDAITSFDFGTLIFGNSANYVLSVMLYPKNFGTTSSNDIYINGRQISGCSGYSLYPSDGTNLGSSAVSGLEYIDYIDMTSISSFLDDYDDNKFILFSEYSDVELFLPYYGFVPIDLKLFINYQYLWIGLITDFTTGKAQYCLYLSNSSEGDGDKYLFRIIDFQLGVVVPFGGNTTAETYNNIILGGIKAVLNATTAGVSASFADSIVESDIFSTRRGSRTRTETIGARGNSSTSGEIGFSATGAASGLLGVLQPISYVPIEKSNDGSFCMYSLPFYPYLYINYPEVNEIDNYAHLYGRPSMEEKTLSDLSGFTIMKEVHLDTVSLCTSRERDAIYNILTSGFII